MKKKVLSPLMGLLFLFVNITYQRVKPKNILLLKVQIQIMIRIRTCTGSQQDPSPSANHAYGVTMVLILDGNSDIGVHVRSNLCYLTCLRQLNRSRAVTNRILFLLRKTYISFLRVQHVLSYHITNISTMG